MKIPVRTTIACFALFALSANRCEEKKMENTEVLQGLYEQYKFGSIEQCTYEGKKVYHAGINAFDAGTIVYDETGKKIGTCNYMARLVDPPCEKLLDCETVYRCENHISGEPAVDKYGLKGK